MHCQWSERLPGSEELIDCYNPPVWLLGMWFPQLVVCEVHKEPVGLVLSEYEFQPCAYHRGWVYWYFHAPLLARAPVRNNHVLWSRLQMVQAVDHAEVFVKLTRIR